MAEIIHANEVGDGDGWPAKADWSTPGSARRIAESATRAVPDADRDQRRMKKLTVPKELVLRLVLFGRADLPRTVAVLTGVHVPDGVEVVDVREDSLDRTFSFLLRHQSFEPVADGDAFPRLAGPLEYKVVDLGERVPPLPGFRIVDNRTDYDGQTGTATQVIVRKREEPTFDKR